MSRDGAIRVVMLPWLAFGHLTSFHQLAIALAKFKIHVSFVSTPRNIHRLPKIPPDLSSFIDFVPLSLPKLDPVLLPEDAEATIDIPEDKIPYLKKAYDFLEQPFARFVADTSPHWLIIDSLPYWALNVACRFNNIPVIRYSVFNAATMAYFECQGEQEENASGAYSGFYEHNASGIPDDERVHMVARGVQAVAIRSCPEFESDYLKVIEKTKKVILVGFLLPELSQGDVHLPEEPWSVISGWLNRQDMNSVVFVGFGSETKLNKDQVHEIARGLEMSGLPFLWALRKPDWATNELECLPSGFTARTAGKGVVHIGWAPQREILAHPAVGGCLFHAGWGSIIESLRHGHRLVLLPFVADQPLNARLLVEKGIGFEVARAEDGTFRGEDVANSLRKAMILEEGEEMRERTRKVAELFGDEKIHDNYVRLFVEYLRNGAKQIRGK